VQVAGDAVERGGHGGVLGERLTDIIGVRRRPPRRANFGRPGRLFFHHHLIHRRSLSRACYA
jgi:hypothetical protein